MSAADYLTQALELLKPGEVTIVDVLHDDECPKLDGGTCDCEAVVRQCPGESCLYHASAGGAVN